MLRRLDGKIALVSGVSQGIGGSIAKAFAAEGAKVVCSGILMDDIAAVVDEIRSSGGAAEKARLDVTSVEEWREVTAAIVRDIGAINLTH